MSEIELRYKRKALSLREKRLYRIKVVTQKQRLAMKGLVKGRVRKRMGRWGYTMRSLARKGLVREVLGWYELTVMGREYVGLRWPWLLPGQAKVRQPAEVLARWSIEDWHLER